VITKEEFPRVIIVRKTDLLKTSSKKKLFKTKNLKANGANEASYIFGPYTSKYQMQIALKIIRRIFPFHSMKQKSEKGCLDFQLGVCPGPYSGSITKEDYKKNIRGIKMILEGKKKSLISKMEKEMHSFAKKHEFEKAASLRNKIHALQHIRDIALMTRDFDNDEFSKKLMSKNLNPFRLEAYDISNISGDHAVGSMVVFENGVANKSQYRKFKIKTVEGSDDVGMMREVLLRRFKNDWPMPDLILLDGGLGHLNMAEGLLHRELGLALDVVAVAKGPTRKKLDIRYDSKISTSTNKLVVKDIVQDENLIKSIMDEAHRFAVTFHRKLRGKAALK
jgi:excinuclease ABC subunit C